MKSENKIFTTLPFELKIFSICENLPQSLSGQGRKGVLVVLPASEWCDATHRPLLEKILHAVRLDLEQDAVLIRLQQGEYLPLQAARKRWLVRYVLAFGCAPAEVGLQIEAEPYRPVALGDINFLFAAALPVLQKEVTHKKALWSAMQQVFKLR